MKVADYWQIDSGWRWKLFASFLPINTLLKLAAIKISADAEKNDRFVWAKNLEKLLLLVKLTKNYVSPISKLDGWTCYERLCRGQESLAALLASRSTT